MKESHYAESFFMLGSTFPPSDDLVSELNKFTCLLYGDRTSSNVDECRYSMFKSGKCSDDARMPSKRMRKIANTTLQRTPKE